MSIRLRYIDGIGLVALCAARSWPHEDDVYLDDETHHALSKKFTADFASMGFLTFAPTATAEDTAREAEESNNPNREWWDRTYGSQRAVPPMP